MAQHNNINMITSSWVSLLTNNYNVEWYNILLQFKENTTVNLQMFSMILSDIIIRWFYRWLFSNNMHVQ